MQDVRSQSSLKDSAVAATLERLHAEARGDWKQFGRILPRALWGALRGRGLMKVVAPHDFEHAYLPVSREAGKLLYLCARSLAAKRVVEFGASFGISTVYLAAAVRDNGGGQVFTTEIVADKCRAAERNLASAGLSDIATVLEGDARDTLRDIEGPIDLVFLDGWKDLYVPVLDILVPKLRHGALILADNINFRDARDYVERVRTDPQFASATLFSDTMELSCFTG